MIVIFEILTSFKLNNVSQDNVLLNDNAYQIIYKH